MLNLGTVIPGSTIEIPFDSFSGSTGASITITGLAVGDIKVYKNGSITERASTAGYTLLDTDGIDFDGITGIQGFSIDLADNTTAGFYEAGARYFVVVSAITVDAQTVNFVAARFVIGYPAAILNTTIATYTSATVFTLTIGPAEADALNDLMLIVHKQGSAVQWGRVHVLDYAATTKQVTLVAAAGFTLAVGDNVSVMAATDPAVSGSFATVNQIADGLLSRSVATVEGSMPEHCLGTIILLGLEWDAVTTPGSILIKRTTGATHVTKTGTTSASADPFTKIE